MKTRQVLVRRGYQDAQLLESGIRSQSSDYSAQCGYIPSPAGSMFDQGYVMTDAPMPAVRRAAKMHNVELSK